MNDLARTLPPHTVDELIFWLPSALSKAETPDWEKGFIKTILARSRRRGWRPTGKQERVMRRLVAEISAPDDMLIDDEGVDGPGT